MTLDEATATIVVALMAYRNCSRKNAQGYAEEAVDALVRAGFLSSDPE